MINSMAAMASMTCSDEREMILSSAVSEMIFCTVMATILPFPVSKVEMTRWMGKRVMTSYGVVQDGTNYSAVKAEISWSATLETINFMAGPVMTCSLGIHPSS